MGALLQCSKNCPVATNTNQLTLLNYSDFSTHCTVTYFECQSSVFLHHNEHPTVLKYYIFYIDSKIWSLELPLHQFYEHRWEAKQFLVLLINKWCLRHRNELVLTYVRLPHVAVSTCFPIRGTEQDKKSWIYSVTLYYSMTLTVQVQKLCPGNLFSSHNLVNHFLCKKAALVV